MNANETCEDSIHGPYEPDDVADHCGGCGIPLCEEHARKCPCCGRVNCTDCGEICEACWRLVCREHAKWNPEYAQYECPACYDRWDCGGKVERTMNPNENEPTPPLTDEEREHRRVRYAQYWASKRVADEWEFDPDGVSRMTGEGDIPSGADDSTAIVEAFGHIAESIVDGERIASGGDAKWLRPLAAMLAARIPFVSGSVESRLSVDVTSSEFLDCCRSVWIGADVHRGFGRYLNLRWDVGRREWVEASSGLAFLGADSQVAFMLETAMAENDGIRFDPMEGKEDAIRLFRLLLETAKCADIPVRFAGGSGSFHQDE